VILNEVARAEALLYEHKPLSDAKSTMSLLARYDIQAARLTQAETATHVREFTLQLFPNISRFYVDRRLGYYVEHGGATPLLQLSPIPITSREVGRIAALPTIKHQCLAFSALAMAKYGTARKASTNDWIWASQLRELMLRGNLQIPNDELYLTYYHELYTAGLIGLTKRVDNCNIQVLFADRADDAEVVMELCEADYFDLGYCWRAYCGEPFVRCAECGRWIKQAKNGRRRYCRGCAAVAVNLSKTASKQRSRLAVS
jgi:hypothetical protein